MRGYVAVTVTESETHSMPPARQLLTAVALIASLAGCESAPVPGLRLSPEFRYANAEAADAPEGGSPPTVTVVGDRVTVNGRIGAGDPCHALQATVVATDAVLEVAIVAEARPVPCVQVVTAFTYEARSELPRDVTRIVVTHVSRAPGRGDQRSIVYDAPLP